LAVVAYLLIPAYFFVSADALVQGDLVPVTPLYRARLDQLRVKCDDRVVKGQTLAVISNFLVQADYQQQYEKSLIDLNLAKIALDQGVAEARVQEEAAHQHYLAADIDAHRVEESFREYDAAYRAGAIGRAEWAARQLDWQAAVATASAARQTWAHATDQVARVQIDQQAKIDIDREASGRVASLAQRVSSEPLKAPVGGYIVNCIDRPQNVVEPSVALFDIFDPTRAYVLAYFDPNAMDRVPIGQTVEVMVAGIPKTFQGHVVRIYPTLVKLPDELTRFFWQHVQWSEYRPVRIDLDGVSALEREQLYYGAQTRVRVRVRRSWNPFAP
jgi:multidrug resistance efflux pump